MKSRLTEQITYLLLQHGYVAVPQLGGFLRELLPAGYDAQLRQAYPPRAELRFSKELVHSDGLLESRYAALLGMSLRRARLELEDDIRELRQQLLQQHSCELAGLGLLSLSSEGRLSFLPQEDSPVLRAVSYGYAPLTLPLLAQPSEGAPALASRGVEDGRYLSFRIPKRAVGYAACLVVLLLSLLPWGNQVGQEASYQAGFVPTLEVAQELFGKAEEQKPAATSEEVAPASQGLLFSDSIDGRYHIIVATERREEQIQASYDRLRAELPEATFVALRTTRGRMIRLSVGAYATSSEAYEALNRLAKAQPAVRGAWVYASK